MERKRVEYEIEYDGKKYRFLVYELTYAEMQEVMRKVVGESGKIKIYGNEMPVIDVDIVAYGDALLKKAVKNIDGSDVDFDNLPFQLVEPLVTKAMEMNPKFRLFG